MLRRFLLLTAPCTCLVTLLACSSDQTASRPSSGFITDASVDGDASQPPIDAPYEWGGEWTAPPDAACKTGEACGDGGICAGGECCALEHACGDACCPSGQVCSFQKCVTPGAECHDATDCAASEYCEYSLSEASDAGAPDAGENEAGACVGGTNLATGKCLPRPPSCAQGESGVTDGGAVTCLQPCEYKPAATDFQAVEAFAWGGMNTPPYDSDIMMTPIVIQLDDDDCDGKVTANDIPEIVFTTFSGGAYTAVGTVRAISIVDGAVVEKWAVPGVLMAMGELAAGNIDGVAGNEVVGCGGGGVTALKADGSVLWQTAETLSCRMPGLADLDGDGNVEVVVEGGVIDGKTGTILFTLSPAHQQVVSDLDNDGQLDIVTSSRAYRANGTLFVDTGKPGSWPAIGDFDKDGVPEVIAVDYGTHSIWVWHYDAAEPGGYKLVRDAIDINGALDPALCPPGSAGNTKGGGPPTVADFNGDGYPDVALAGGVGYAVLDGKKLMDSSVPGPSTFLWVKQTHDCSSAATGSSIFDFNGDGRAEVVYSDEYYLRIYQGDTGDVLFETCNTTGTLIEYPVVADVDNDGQANIIVVSNAYAYSCNGTKQSGLRVFSSATNSWVRTRRVWNQHAYHVTNVEEDGTIPVHELANWKQPGLNNFRQNKQPGSEFAAPDAVVELYVPCGAKQLVATVRNLGEAALPAGLTVSFLEGTAPGGVPLGQGMTTRALYSAQSEQVVLTLAAPSGQLASGQASAYATIAVPAAVHECRPDNNASVPASAICGGPK
jgi:hypothetical protein